MEMIFYCEIWGYSHREHPHRMAHAEPLVIERRRAKKSYVMGEKVAVMFLEDHQTRQNFSFHP